MKKEKTFLTELLDLINKYKPDYCKVPSYLIRDDMIASARRFIHDWDMDSNPSKGSKEDAKFAADIFAKQCEGIR